MKNLKMNVWRLLSLSLAMMVTISFSSCDDDDDDIMPTSDDVVDVLVDDSNFTVLVSAVVAAQLGDDLSGTGPFTVLAPTDAAFGDFITDNNLTAEALIGNTDLANILSYHVVSGNVTSGDVAVGPVSTLTGEKFYVSADPNGGLWINGNTMITAVDKMASNGVIHTLDYVITAPTMSIAEIAVGSTTASTPEFTQLVAALSRAGLVDAVSGDSSDDLTVFAPTDAAFEDLYAALGVSGVDDIDVDLLTSVLLYHVVPARAFSQDLRDGASLPTLLEGKSLSVDLPNLMINDSDLVSSMLNIHATNGVIHVIDKVMLPE
ncbi:fasciclin domain-containing protein [Algoriphagus aquimarinus]|uniref:Uncaracterized surface protein containing fasciclin (FAS1) repeats n=2 Tax=Algoriphagus aquimarinus TaxID=237018 RepID=A0A1I1BMK7_9BACT|nr:fasciclin domain-containing protein [Algoriphagus aquimarinus]SFB51644.1 Uncaracterized surface protein containing fasciclin (FAS1) repeats [Algoriphagus aquimarinus]